ncbi:hypothetical protein L917_08900 [Phytophthora nicotianae]|uniref:Uncharacterized protein n=1 Tax=Phytophthora nicotianae TaxID=4792 RepID=W2L608_PHYNI|nr:hypothetical protein L917_08900 [Phytophthora nicotianae]
MEGAPVSRLMLQFHAKAIASEGQTTPDDSHEAAKVFRTQVLQTIVEKTAYKITMQAERVFKIAPSKVKEKRVQNDTQRHGSSSTKWNRKIRPLQERHNCQIYGNRCA